MVRCDLRVAPFFMFIFYLNTYLYKINLYICYMYNLKHNKMEVSIVLTHTEAMHRHYVEMANDCLEQYKSEPKDNQVMRDFYLKKSTEYLHKAEALWGIIKYIKS